MLEVTRGERLEVALLSGAACACEVTIEVPARVRDMLELTLR
jgi:hypothetical protein